jgi:Fe-S cluster biosynthesis and repair protein YggX
MMSAEARKYILEQMDKFFNNEATDRVTGYVDPADIVEL